MEKLPLQTTKKSSQKITNFLKIRVYGAKNHLKISTFKKKILCARVSNSGLLSPPRNVTWVKLQEMMLKSRPYWEDLCKAN